ncbi:hypothetical protein [Trebonia sp.]|uniref:hypothetical protein n=1 Tax=Trebonia sp. TaxID=2767075 RepID=UPI0026064D99|nr:hypothetical protein [Trebonia sp.]
MANLTNPIITQLLEQYQPQFFFDPTELFFPSVAEEVLGHEATESWDNVPTHQRGTAVLLAPLSSTAYSASEVQAGVDDPHGAPLTFDSTPPEGIGQHFAYNSASNDLFLDCAGWDDTASFAGAGGVSYSSGSVEYLQSLFSALGHAMNGTIPITSPSPAPRFSVPRTILPTIYAELEWAGRYPVLDQDRVSQIGGQNDFPMQSAGSNEPEPFSGLNKYLALTYHLFYPAMEPSPVGLPDPDERYREGQWEAVTIFLEGDPDFAVTDQDGRPDFLFAPGKTALTPRFLAYSTGYGLGDDNFNPLSASIQPWPDGTTASQATVFLDAHPWVYVTAGTHKNLYGIDAVVTPGTSSPDAGLNTTGAAIMGAAGTFLGVCISIAAAGAATAGVALAASVPCLIIGWILLMIGFFLFALSFGFPTQTSQTETPQSSQPGTDVARNDGPSTAPAASTASSIVATTLRLISNYTFDSTPPISTYPLPSPLPATGAVEMPSWWGFAGRWGVRVTPAFSGSWDSGSRRTDPFGRSRAYWNAYQLVQYVAASGGTVTL